MGKTAAKHPKKKARRAPHSESEAKLRAILDTAADAIISIDDHGIVETYNRAAEKMFGYPQIDVVGRNISMLMPPHFAEHHDQWVQRYLKTGRAKIIGVGREVQGMRKDGSIFPMHLAVSEVPSGKRRTFVGIAHDITNRKRLEKALVMASENERREIGKDLHDVLGQQMTGISLLARALAQKQGDHVAADAGELSTLAREALGEVKRLSHGLYPTELERHGLFSALEEMADNFSKLYGFEVRYHGPRSIADLSKEVELQMYRIAQEAVNNAVKHSEGTTIWIRVAKDARGLILTVEDDGKGPPGRAVQERGMGLSIMKHRASMAGMRFALRRGAKGGTLVSCHMARD